ncbi:hypothetical protein CSQ94_13805, partial [Janthinobacterium sp. BJB312]
MDILIGDNVPWRIFMKKKQLPSKREIIPTSPESTPKLRATFTDAFKRDAVARLRAGNQSATDLAVELGLRRNQLYKWAKKLDEQSLEEALRSPGRPPTGNLSEIEQLRRDLASAQEELAILKKLDAYLTRLKEVKYAVIDAHRSEFSVKSLCRVLDISRSLYYAFKKARPSLRSQQDLALRAKIVAINTAHRWAPGGVKMWHLLKAEGIQCGKHRVIRLRKLEDIQTTRMKRFRVMQAKERVQPPAPDLVKRAFQVDASNKIWVGDITSLRTREGWIHLAIVLDLFARRVVGWAMNSTQAA